MFIKGTLWFNKLLIKLNIILTFKIDQLNKYKQDITKVIYL